MKKQIGNAATAGLGLLFVVALVLGAVFGWVMNIVKLVGMTLDPLTGELIVRAIGIFVFPVGCIMGYF